MRHGYGGEPHDRSGRRFAHRLERGHPGRHGGWGRGGGRGRFFDSGELRLVILALIAEQPRHGYELIKDIEQRLVGAYAPSPGVVYPTLTMLEDMGLAVASPEAGGRKLYSATEEGRAHLAENRDVVDALFRRIAEAGAGRDGALPQVMRALHNLRLALRLRLARGGLTEPQIRTIVETIDAAAVTIERT